MKPVARNFASPGRPGAIYDVAIIGGGPAGCAAAITLARQGVCVALFERQRFPRFHVGESLLPGQGAVLERLGVRERIASAGFVEKYGGFFLSNDGSCSSPIDFEKFLEPPNNFAFQVERAQFDSILLDQAMRQGAEVFEQHSVVGAELAAEDCRLTVRSASGANHEVRARWVLDASGQKSFLARRLGVRQEDNGLRKVSHFAHFAGGRQRTGRQAGYINLVLGDGCWFWHIPLREGRASVGCVVDRERWAQSDQEAAAFYHQRLASSPFLVDFLDGAEQVTEVHTEANFSYSASRFSGSGWTLLGDAAAFLDPIFSTGVLLALLSGEAAGETLARALQRGRPLTARLFRGYERRMRGWSRDYCKMIRAFYDPQFAAVIFNPVAVMQKPMVRFLAGHADRSWLDRLVLNAFFAVVWINRYLPLNRDPRPAEVTAHHG